MQLQLRPSEEFIKLVEYSGKEFTPTIYDLMSYIQTPKDADGMNFNIPIACDLH